VESSFRRTVNLNQYRRLDGKWQFVPVVKENGKPNPKLVLVNGVPVSSKGGTFYLDWRGRVKRLTRPAGTSPREALDAWRLQSGIFSDEIKLSEEPVKGDKGLTIDNAIEKYLVEVRATKGERTHRAYRQELLWFRKHSKKRYVSELNRSERLLVQQIDCNLLLRGFPRPGRVQPAALISWRMGSLSA
jgi:hypothetical protein